MRALKKLVTFAFVLALGLGAGYVAFGRKPTPSADAKKGKILYYVDPMHPQYKSDKPGVAPDCGMDLVPVYEGGPDPAAAYGQSSSNPMPAGTVQIPAEKQQLIGVKFGEVQVVPLSRSVRTTGKVTFDETKIARIHTKFEGWIENTEADSVGKFVEQGEPLIGIYSPELVATQQEFLLAAKARGYLGNSDVREVAAGANSLYEAAKRRLELWDITDQQIADLIRRNAPMKTMTIYSPISGYILARNAFPRQRVTPETELYQIADLRTVWVLADVYEYEAGSVSVGQPARMTLSYLPGRQWQGKVTYIYPQVDNTTRSLKARLEFANPDLALKPDMFANVDLVVNHGRQLAVPEEAVLNSGAESTVFVDRGNGYLEPRRVTLGEKVGALFIVRDGLKAGDRVVTSGNFLVDSESKLKSALTSMTAGGQHQHGSEAAGTPEATPAAPATKPSPVSPQPPKPEGPHD